VGAASIVAAIANARRPTAVGARGSLLPSTMGGGVASGRKRRDPPTASRQQWARCPERAVLSSGRDERCPRSSARYRFRVRMSRSRLEGYEPTTSRSAGSQCWFSTRLSGKPLATASEPFSTPVNNSAEVSLGAPAQGPRAGRWPCVAAPSVLPGGPVGATVFPTASDGSRSDPDADRASADSPNSSRVGVSCGRAETLRTVRSGSRGRWGGAAFIGRPQRGPGSGPRAGGGSVSAEYQGDEDAADEDVD
jgi:hypothetical protein